MTEQTSTTLLSGWIDPLAAHFDGDHLDLVIYGSFAGQQAQISVCLVDAHHHALPAEPRDRITAAFGNWLELSGTFHASPVDDCDCNGHTGYVTDASASFSHRVVVDPWSQLPGKLPRKMVTAYFGATIPWLTGDQDPPRPAP